jgi:hypothetical protein
MPGFVKSPKDEARWEKSKSAAAKRTKEGSDSYWKLSNYIFHRMGKTEEDQRLAEYYKTELLKAPSISAPMKTGSVAVKMPKAKKPPDPFGKPSLYFKSEVEPKILGVEKLRQFLTQRRLKTRP